MAVGARGHGAERTEGRSPSRRSTPFAERGSAQPLSFPDFFFFQTLEEVMLDGCGWCLRGPVWDGVSLKVQVT